MKKKNVQDLFEGAPPKKEEPPKSEWDSEWNMDELFGNAPRRFKKRWKEKKMSRGLGIKERTLIQRLQPDGAWKDTIIKDDPEKKGFQRAFRSLSAKGLVTEEPKTVLEGYKITIRTWISVTKKSDFDISGTLKMK